VTSVVKAEPSSTFKSRPKHPRTWWQLWFRRPSRAAAEVDIENLFAAKAPGDISPSHISAIVAEHRLKPKDLGEIRTVLWRKAITSVVKDNEITENEAAWLASIRRALQVSDREARAVEETVVHPRYKAKVSEVLADGFLSATERDDLDKLMDGLRISKEDYATLYAPVAKEVLTTQMNQMLEDHRVTPEELADLASAAKSMRIDPTLGDETEALVRRFGEYWKIENGELPVETGTSISLQRGETCHYVSANVTWSEPRTKTITTDLGSIGYSFRIARGVYYRSPRIRATRVRQDVLTALADGEVYFTSKRVIFDGDSRNFSVKLNGLIGIEVYSDGIKLEKATGRSPVLLMTDVERAAVILSALLARA